MSNENGTPRRPQLCVVTGGAGGLGVGVCRELASSGAHVVVADLAGERAEAAAADFRAEGLSAAAMAIDVTDGRDVARARDELVAEYGRVDAVISMAGVVRNAALSKVTDVDFHLTWKSHVAGTMLMMREFGPLMKKQGYGRFVNTSSVAALGTAGSTSYSAAKGAVEAMSRTAAIELAPFGVTVNCIAPGIIDAGMFLSTPQAFQQQVLTRTPMRRVGRVEEVAACVRFLASAEASFITGQTIFVCGGASIGAF